MTIASRALRLTRAALHIGVLGATTACAGPSIQAQVDVVRADLVRAREAKAYECAPRELALAEANVDFAEVELAEGDFVRAGAHIDIAVDNTQRALAATRSCGEPAAPVIVRVDRDSDGIADNVDECPDAPEDRDNDRDADGRPDIDADQDGVDDCVAGCAPAAGTVCDACPTETEDKDGYQDEDGCADLDNDGDGILDKVDACPLEAGALELRGCPDKDGDKIGDADDKCPDVRGVDQRETKPERHGCPVEDRDGDGIVDTEDKCPDEVGVLQPEDPSQNGCPKKFALIVVKKDEIQIKQQVLFESGRAVIKAQSFKLLAEVGEAIRTSSLTKVTIEGHTDDVGDDAFNLKLSQQRADSVRQHLIDKEKLDPGILVAKGFGEEAPIASNRTRAGKAQNRRVEFKVERE